MLIPFAAALVRRRRITSTLNNDNHRKIGFEVLVFSLLAIVEGHLEQPVPADIELDQPMAGNVGRGRREAVRTWRNNAQSVRRRAPLGWRNIAP